MNKVKLLVSGLIALVGAVALAGSIAQTETISLEGDGDTAVLTRESRAYNISHYAEGTGYIELRETTATGVLLRKINVSSGGSGTNPFDASLPIGTQLYLRSNLTTVTLTIDATKSTR